MSFHTGLSFAPTRPEPVRGALNDTWKWIDVELTLVTIPGAGHFVRQDAAERVTRVMADWLAR